ncbi:MAG: MinD/ParA family ATP-binding protein [Planctomycetaceae bacterium]
MSDQASELRNLVLRANWPAAAFHEPAPKQVVVAAGREGAGATTVAINLAVALARHGQRAVLLEADLSGNGFARVLGTQSALGMRDVISARRDIHEVLELGPGGIQIASSGNSGLPNQINERSVQRLQKQIDALGRYADVVVIDAGHRNNLLSNGLWQTAAEVLLVTTPDAVAIMETYSLIKAICGKKMSAPSLQLVTNRTTTLPEAQDVHTRLDRSVHRFLGLSLALAGVLPEEQLSSRAQAARIPLLLHQPAGIWSRAMDQVAEGMLARLIQNETHYQARAA